MLVVAGQVPDPVAVAARGVRAAERARRAAAPVAGARPAQRAAAARRRLARPPRARRRHGRPVRAVAPPLPRPAPVQAHREPLSRRRRRAGRHAIPYL